MNERSCRPEIEPGVMQIGGEDDAVGTLHHTRHSYAYSEQRELGLLQFVHDRDDLCDQIREGRRIGRSSVKPPLGSTQHGSSQIEQNADDAGVAELDPDRRAGLSPQSHGIGSCPTFPVGVGWDSQPIPRRAIPGR